MIYLYRRNKAAMGRPNCEWRSLDLPSLSITAWGIGDHAASLCLMVADEKEMIFFPPLSALQAQPADSPIWSYLENQNLAGMLDRSTK